MEQEKLLTVRDVATLLSCSESLVRRADMKQALGAVRIGKRGVRFKRELIEAYLQSQRTDSTECKSEKKVHKKSMLTSKHGLW
ncbi:helix-turn-helix transcriptional regulator [Oleidesulfovibrio alaskensis]|jgi:excisionase family DNA binding protein|uniref:helix-turn-helix transcriptional regulator n=1 Tax=Oleidesulfovibrio alaskensis TaxID=58180 RepID=UPI00005D62F8|nr:helix-turn-helix domain-containing protein [Oleidesulfovibrio alaskensis]